MHHLCRSFGLLAGTTLVGWNLMAYQSQEIPGEYLVKMKDLQVVNNLQDKISLMGGSTSLISEASSVLLVKRPVIEQAAHAMNVLSNMEGVEYVEPNQKISIQSTPNDPSFSELWGLVNADKDGARGVDIKALEAWGLNTGTKEVIVAVIDTGIDHNHPDLKENMWVNQAELSGTEGVDDDNNGFVDDVHGYNFADSIGNSFDDQGHGTHCAGTIGARGNDGVGIVGVNWQVSLMAVKFLDKYGSGTLAGGVAAIDYAIQNGAKVLSNSWGGYFTSQALEDAVKRSRDAGTVFIAAAGNESRDNNRSSNALYPASYKIENVISVASIQKDGSLSSFSNTGSQSVHLGAPGSNIYSTVPGGYDVYSGTSMATPHVAGVAGLILAQHPELTGLEVKDRLLNAVTKLPSLNNKTITGGLLNAYDAVK
jgi:subtilisin family serine protease